MSAPPQRILCPYCGTKNPATEERCTACGGFFDELSRRVTQQHMGPWFIREPEQPFRPGCSFAVIAKQVERGKITTKTIMKGPTTRQFWAMAASVPGVANLLGVCHACSGAISKVAQSCPSCGASFPMPDDRDELGLDPEDSGVFEEAERAHAEFAAQQEEERKRQVAQQQAAAAAQVKPSSPPAVPAAPAAAATAAATPTPPAPPAGAPATPAAPPQAPAAAAAVVTPQPPAQTPASPKLDDISWMSGEAGSTPAPAEASGNGAMKWIVALVGVNVVLALAVVAILVGGPGPKPNDPGADDPPSDPNPPTDVTSPGATNPNEVASVNNPDASNPTNPGTPTTPDPPDTTNPRTVDPGGTTVLGPGDTVTIPGPDEPDPTPTLPDTGTPTDPVTGPDTQPSGAVSFFNIEAAPGAPKVSQQVIDGLNRRFEEANQLAIAGKWPQALQKLEDLKASMPSNVKSDELDIVIQSVREKVKEMKKVDDFFDS